MSHQGFECGGPEVPSQQPVDGRTVLQRQGLTLEADILSGALTGGRDERKALGNWV